MHVAQPNVDFFLTVFTNDVNFLFFQLWQPIHPLYSVSYTASFLATCNNELRAYSTCRCRKRGGTSYS